MPEAPHGPLLTIVLAPAERLPSVEGRATRFAAMLRALDAIAAADPALTLRVDDGLLAELGGPDEASLDQAVDALRAVFAVDVGSPKVSYREAVGSTLEIDQTIKRQGLFARLKLRVAPTAGGFVVDPCLPGGLPPALLAGALAGLAAAARAGCLGGFPMTATAATIIDGAWHDPDSTPDAFAEAGRFALWEALRRAGYLLEPVMRVEVVAPEDYEGAVTGDVVSRRGQVERVGWAGAGELEMSALVPLANLLGYGSDLASLTRGRGRHASRFACHRALPRGGGGDPPHASAAALRA